MTFNWGDESIFINKMAKKINSGSGPYDYESEILLENEFGFSGDTKSGMTRTDVVNLAASVAGALMLSSLFIHADAVKDVVSEVPEQIIGVFTSPIGFKNNIYEFFRSMSI